MKSRPRWIGAATVSTTSGGHRRRRSQACTAASRRSRCTQTKSRWAPRRRPPRNRAAPAPARYGMRTRTAGVRHSCFARYLYLMLLPGREPRTVSQLAPDLLKFRQIIIDPHRLPAEDNSACSRAAPIMVIGADRSAVIGASEYGCRALRSRTRLEELRNHPEGVVDFLAIAAVLPFRQLDLCAGQLFVGDLAQDVSEGVQPRPPLVVGMDDVPRRP
jgi:hypothetical protein